MPEIDEETLARVLSTVLDKHPKILEEIADRMASRIIASITAEGLSEGTGPASSQCWSAPDEQINGLLAWVDDSNSRIIHGDRADWARAVVAASGNTHPHDVFAWAFSETCQTNHWRHNQTPIAAPTPTKSGAPKAGQYTQMLAEFRATHTAAGAHAVAGIDRLIDAIAEQVRFYGLTDQVKPTLAWRRNALAILRSSESADPADVITWAMRNRNHWRSNIQCVPAERTFRKILGDYVAAGAGFQLARDGGEHAESIDQLARGWACYLAKLLKRDTVAVRPSSHRSVWELLTGGDGGEPVPEKQLQQVVRWILDPDAGRARFYTNGDDFPPPAKTRKALVDMATDTPRTRGAAGSGVSTTNVLAGDGIVTGGATTVTVEGI